MAAKWKLKAGTTWWEKLEKDQVVKVPAKMQKRFGTGTILIAWPLDVDGLIRKIPRGKKRVTPYWRVVRTDGGLNEKLPGGAKEQARRLREEGHGILPSKGKKAVKVREFDQVLVDF